MSPTDVPLKKRRRMVELAAIVLMAATPSVYAATSTPIGSGTMAYSDLIGGPATVSMRTLTIAPGESLGWHQHPGSGAYTIVVSGTLTIEDGCGGETTYTQGQAFLEPPGRVHRGKNLTTANVVTAQMFIVPQGTPTSHPHSSQMCGIPMTVEECKDDGWRKFDFPGAFISQGQCVDFVLNGEIGAD